MSKNLNKSEILTNSIIEPSHITQLIDALSGLDDYNLSISGSLTVTEITGSAGVINNISASYALYSPPTYNTLQVTSSITFPLTDYISSGGTLALDITGSFTGLDFCKITLPTSSLSGESYNIIFINPRPPVSEARFILETPAASNIYGSIKDMTTGSLLTASSGFSITFDSLSPETRISVLGYSEVWNTQVTTTNISSSNIF